MHRLAIPVLLGLLMLTAPLSGCLGSDEPDPVDPRDSIPIPDWPPCPEGSECANAHTCSATGGSPVPTFTESWNSSGDNRIWASPRLAELTGDGILDVVFGTGVEEGQTGSTVALDGSNGSLLWEVGADQEIFASAKFHDIDSDGTLDVVAGGRMSQLFAISGASGDVIWRFDVNSPERANWYQFYSGQFVDDVDGDNTPDWLTANGGDPTKQAGAARSPGYLMLLSGATGEVLSVANVPDGRETYMSIYHYKPHPDLPAVVLFGTGGETFPGSLWATNLDDLLDGDISDAIELLPPEEGVDKGIVAPPAIVDLTLDGILDVVVSSFDGRTVAIDGRNYSILWTLDAKDHAGGGGINEAETYATPAIGYFSDDAVPDVAVHFSVGAFPIYRSSWTGVIDGATGELIWSADAEHTAFASPLAVDLTGDGRDEVVMTRGAGLFTPDEYYEVSVLDTCAGMLFEMTNSTGASLGTPTIADADGDGDLEMFIVSHTSFPPRWTVQSFDLDAATPESISWGAYLGTAYDGLMQT